MTLVSVVAPCFNEAPNIPELVGRITSAMSGDSSWELILVDDGSRDETWSVIRKTALDEPRIIGVRLSDNHGQQAALLAGLARSRGRCVVTLDADLQHPPEVIPAMLACWTRGAQVVHTQRVNDDEWPFFKRWTSRVFNRLASVLSGAPMPPGSADFRLMDRDVVAEVVKSAGARPFIRGQITGRGYREESVPYRFSPRTGGSSGYTWPKMIRLAADGFLTMSERPVRTSISLGVFFTVIASLWGFWGIGVRVTAPGSMSRLVPEWATVVAAVTFFSGILFIQVGWIGSYVARVLRDTRTRPAFTVAETTPDRPLESGATADSTADSA